MKFLPLTVDKRRSGILLSTVCGKTGRLRGGHGCIYEQTCVTQCAHGARAPGPAPRGPGAPSKREK